MRSVRYLLPVLLLALVVSMTFTSCAKPADEEIMEAEDAIHAAESVGAESASPNLFGKAVKQLQDAKMFNDQGDYKKARSEAVAAKVNAESAKRYADGSAGSQRRIQADD